MKKPILHFGKAIQELITGKRLKNEDACCKQYLKCCILIPNYKDSNYQFILRGLNALPVPFCIS